MKQWLKAGAGVGIVDLPTVLINSRGDMTNVFVSV